MESDLAPVYAALIRRELRLPSGSPPLDCLEARLTSRDPNSKPPYRAPAIVRLRRALKRLRAAKAPATPPDQFADDLRFLQLFAPGQPVLTAAGARRLLADVLGDGESRGGEVVPFRKHRRKQGGAT